MVSSNSAFESDFRVQTSLKTTEPVNIYIITSFFNEVPTAVEKDLNSFNSNVCVCVCVCVLSRGIILYE